MPVCTLCKLLVTNVSKLLTHYNNCHETENLHTDFIFACAEDQCCRAFGRWESFRQHLIIFHKYDCNDDSVKKSRVSEQLTTNGNSSITFEHAKFTSNQNNINYDQQIEVAPYSQSDKVHGYQNKDGENTETDIEHINIENFKAEIRQALVIFSTKLYANPNLPRNHVQEVFEDNEEFMFTVLKHVNQMTELSNSIKVFTECLNDFLQSIKNSFDFMGTEYKRFEYFKQIGFIEPTSIQIGTREENKYIDGKIIKVREPVFLQYISIEKVLKSFLSLPGTLNEILLYMEKLNYVDILTNFIQANLWKRKIETYFAGKVVLPLFIYFDDFQVNNPLGSHNSIQKLGAIYASIPCIPPQFRSTVENIFLLMLFHSADRYEFNNEIIFSSLIKEINHLQENGMIIKVDGQERKIFVSVGLIIGDNLGLNSIFNFTESFMSNYFCKLCKTPLFQTQTDLREREQNFRKVVDYEKDVKAGIKQSGLKGSSVWNKLKYFHIYENFYVDPFHDINEGVLKYDLSHLLFHYIFVSKEIPLEVLNDRINTFDYYSNSISNKPPPFTEDEIRAKNVKLSGSEMLNLTLVFPFLIGDLINTNSDYWMFFLILRQIIDIIQARNIQSDSATLLNELVADHHELYLKLFKDPLKRKHHFLTHYGTVLKMSGPLVNLTTNRFESKHKFFTDCARSTTSRKNITYTLTMKEQLRFLHRLIRETGFSSDYQLGPSTTVNFDDFQYQIYFNDLSSLKGKHFYTSSSLQFNGITYKLNMFILLYYEQNGLPVFGHIKHIFYSEEKTIYFGFKRVCALYFEEKLHSFKVTELHENGLININDIYSPFTAIFHRMPNGDKYIMLRNTM